MNASNRVRNALVILGTATAAEVAHRADISVSTARKWLDQFVSQGNAESHACRPITRYTIR